MNVHPVQYISNGVLWVFGHGAVAYNPGVLACNFASADRIAMFLGALERSGSLVYNAPKNTEIR